MKYECNVYAAVVDGGGSVLVFALTF